ncbi:hypothetical protein H2509_04680 [Stappia sp. F7233]|uniref:Glycosyltransferase RgtA/B/C/D-like domain-containing protein n=1 Tax=Stappia albiluteola TaxID=2758565 RepID=A0A839A9V1_9HYPH|nr:hypothetical protein [Stappia albiluteola]MBA5776420.1 hypothetical protein [Stappia albiluteola]
MTNRKRASMAALTALLFAASLTAALMPLLVADNVHMQDLPNHAARAFILLNQDDPLLARHFYFDWRPEPNLGFEGIVLAFGPWLGHAGTITFTVALMLLLPWSGTIAVSCAINRKLTPLALLATPFAFNGAAAMGFVGFELGLGLALWAIAGWILLSRQPRWARLAYGLIASSLLYAAHLMAFGIYGVFVALWSLSLAAEDVRAAEPQMRLFSARGLGAVLRTFAARAWSDGLQALPAATVFFLYSEFSQPLSTVGQTPSEIANPLGRLKLVGRLVDAGPGSWCRALSFLSLGIIALGVILRRIKIDRRMMAPIAVFLVLFLLAPGNFNSTGHLGWRFILPFGFLLAASLRPGENGSSLTVPVLAALSVGVSVIANAVLISSYKDGDAGLRDIHRILPRIAEGSRVYFGFGDVDKSWLHSYAVGLYHAQSLIVTERRGLVQTLFTYRGQQPLRLRDEAIQNAPGNSVVFLAESARNLKAAGIDPKAHILGFDYLLTYGELTNAIRQNLPGDAMTQIAEAGDYRLFQLVTPERPENNLRVSERSTVGN